MQEILQKIVDNIPGAQGAILMGFDGIAVMQAVRDGSDTDIESVAMEFSFRFIELCKAAESLEMGTITDITVKADGGTLITRVLSEEFFVSVFLADPRHLGRGRWVLRTHAVDLAAQL